MGKTNIENFDWVWNPVRGCNNTCEYCYARKNNTRFWGPVITKELRWYEQNYEAFPKVVIDIEKIQEFQPSLIWSSLRIRFPEKASKIFINSMSDIQFWKRDWMKAVLKRIREFPQHHFFFLTKNLMTYEQFDFPDNVWLGVTIDTQQRANGYLKTFRKKDTIMSNRFWISFEPLLTDVQTSLLSKASWAIVGAETGNREDRITPDRRWVKRISEECKMYNVPLYMKNSLQRVWGGKLRKEFPEW